MPGFITRLFYSTNKRNASTLTVLMMGVVVSPEMSARPAAWTRATSCRSYDMSFSGPEYRFTENNHFRACVQEPLSCSDSSLHCSDICIDILDNQWSPELTLWSTLISIQSLLDSPNPSGSGDPEVMKHYITDKDSFEDTARHWTRVYAGGTEMKAGEIPVGWSGGQDEVTTAGLEMAHVDQTRAFDFEGGEVVCVGLSNRRIFISSWR
jgi:Ubiquitin-conjugating enzyme